MTITREWLTEQINSVREQRDHAAAMYNQATGAEKALVAALAELDAPEAKKPDDE